MNKPEKLQSIAWEDLKNFNEIKSEEIRLTSSSKRSCWKLVRFIVSIQGIKFSVQNSPFDNIPKKVVSAILLSRAIQENIKIDNLIESVVRVQSSN